MGPVVSPVVAGLPHHALQSLQRGDLAVLGHPLQQLLDQPLLVLPGQAGLVGDFIQCPTDVLPAAVLADQVAQLGCRIGKQHVLDEIDGAGGALDVGENGAQGHDGSRRLKWSAMSLPVSWAVERWVSLMKERETKSELGRMS